MQQPNGENEAWKYRLDRFSDEYGCQLAALSWGLHLENPDREETLGLDLHPAPHFVFCSREAIETLNRNTGNRLQETIGLIDACQPEKEVLMIAIGAGQIKLLYFEPEIPPPICFEQSGQTIEEIARELEERLMAIFTGVRSSGGEAGQGKS
ncbi:MAG: hypothetical protein J7647_27000 [Cyanobacteria bacterium SBLK]|nr:hypothetical protein [Cyanobacteria bacterium SBLK]